MKEKNKSIWYQDVKITERPALKEDIRVEAAVIGGGLTGILTAFLLKEAGIQAVVLEADRIGSGQTGRTTAKITLQHSLCYQKLIKEVGFNTAAAYAAGNREGLNGYKKLIHQHHIDCEYRSCSSILYTKKDIEALENEALAASKLGISCRLAQETELPFPVTGALVFDDQATFHPLLFLSQISQKLNIYEHTKVTAIENHTLITAQGRVTADNIIFACHYPFINIPGYYFLRMHQERSYVAAVKGTPPLSHLYYGIDHDGISLRQSGDYLLVGGQGHRTGINSLGNRYERLIAAAEELYPGCEAEECWSAQDGMPLDNIPYIGQLSKKTPNIYVAAGFKKWGMTHAMAAAMIIRDSILKKENPWAFAFDPDRFYLRASANNLIKHGYHSAKGLAEGYLPIKKEIPRCSHMGCRLSWNPEESTWDCPCHGSRFTSEGSFIDAPAKEDLQ